MIMHIILCGRRINREGATSCFIPCLGFTPRWTIARPRIFYPDTSNSCLTQASGCVSGGGGFTTRSPHQVDQSDRSCCLPGKTFKISPLIRDAESKRVAIIWFIFRLLLFVFLDACLRLSTEIDGSGTEQWPTVTLSTLSSVHICV